MTREKIIDFCEMKAQLEPENEDIFSYIIKVLKQETVPREHYESEYLARKQTEYELWKIKEQQPSDDCVSRQAVLDTKVLIELPDGQSFYCISPEDVEELPPVTPTQRWIPVSERPPKDFGKYYVTLKDGDVRIFDFNPDSWIDRALLCMSAVAWMPFEPYKAEKEDE